MDGLCPAAFIGYMGNFMGGYTPHPALTSGALRSIFLRAELGITLTCTYSDRVLEFKACDVDCDDVDESELVDIVTRIRAQFAMCLGSCLTQLDDEADKPPEASLLQMTASLDGLITTANEPVEREAIEKIFLDISLKILTSGLEIIPELPMPLELEQAIKSLCELLELDFESDVRPHINSDSLMSACREFLESEDIRVEGGPCIIDKGSLYTFLHEHLAIPKGLLLIEDPDVVFTYHDRSGNRGNISYKTSYALDLLPSAE